MDLAVSDVWFSVQHNKGTTFKSWVSMTCWM